MWRDVLGDAGEAGVFFDDAFDTAGGDAAVVAGLVNGLGVPRIIEKKSGEGVGAGIEIISNAVGTGLADENGAVFTAFAADHELATFKIDRIAVESYEFGNAEAAGVK